MMFSHKLFLVVGICLGAAYYCPTNQILPRLSHLSRLTIHTKTPYSLRTGLSTTTNAYGQGKNNESCASFLRDLLGHRATGKEASTPYYDAQSQSGRPYYLQAFISTLSIIALHNITTETLQSTVESSVHDKVTALIKISIIYFVSYIASVISSSPFPILVISFIWLYFTGSLYFDMVHYCLHKFSKSPYWILRRIGYLHEVHHLYFNRRLKFNERYLWQNMLCELPLELSCQLLGTWLGYLVAEAFSLTGPGFLSREIFHLVLIFEVLRSFVVAILEGRDSNHQSYSSVVPKDPHTFFVGPEYHALHHVNPSAYIGSSFRVFDWFLGSSYTLRSRRVTMAGLTGSFGQAMKRELQTRESVNCIHELSVAEDEKRFAEILSNTDVLIISLENNCKSVVKTIDLFRAHHKQRLGCLLLPEVWYIASSNHSSTSIEKGFTDQARKYYDAENIIYRHILLPTYTSRFGTTFFGPDFAAKAVLWWIRRGARYIPITTPRAAISGCFKFFYNT